MTEKATIKYVTKTTPNLVGEQIARLKQLFPECVSEDRVDFDRLRAALGDADALAGDDAYAFTWAGKQEAFRAVQTPSAASLAPALEESVNWQTTQHLFIEGENLEVLKLLYKSYFGRVKMIYIDPPYNTGNDFIYRDDYRQPRRAYLEKTGQVDAEGNLLTSNPETSGRYHSDWLTMMYPRLFLARGLLRDDGVIFVSIDDHEVHHLRLLMNEIFGEENFVTIVIWQKVYSPKSSARHFSEDHDYIVVYARNADIWTPNLMPRTAEMDARYSNPDNDTRGHWKPSGLDARNPYSRGIYPITCPSGRVIPGPPSGSYWRVSREKFDELDRDGRIWWGEDGNSVPAIKRFLSEVRPGKVPQTLWVYKEVGHTQEAKKQLLEFVHFDHTDNVLDTLKPTRLIQRMLELTTAPNGSDIIVDFFAGSASTAQAVLELNREDGGNRRFIMVQFPEPLPRPEPHLSTIADIGKERVRRVIAQMRGVGRVANPSHYSANPSHQPSHHQLPLETRQTPEDLGFKVFKLAASTFRQWEAPPGESADALAQQLALFDSGLQEDADPLHVVYEVLLKEGYNLNARIEPLALETNRVYRVTDVGRIDNPTSFYICLDAAIQEATLNSLALDKETTFVCLDTALDDASKVNLALQCALKVI